MCDQQSCFKFEKYIGKNTAVLISATGNLEYQWALETALRLKRIGAEVSLFDLSQFSLRYSARIRIKKFYLPHFTRIVLRNLLLKKTLRIENFVREVCFQNEINYQRIKPKRIQFVPHLMKKVYLREFEDENWGPLKATEIIRTFLSSRHKRLIGDLDYVPLQVALNLKVSIFSVMEFMKSSEILNFESYFLANGRQANSATITKILRAKNKEVMLYESSGGYIFPEKLEARLDYWQSSPANTVETQNKVMCKDLTSGIDYSILSEVKSIIRDRSQVAFTLDYLTPSPAKVEKIPLGSHRNYAFFATTDWEISVLFDKPVVSGFFQNQIEAVECILESIGPFDRLFIRLHPGDPNIETSADDIWKQFEVDRRVIFINPDDRTDSYALAKLMDANFVWTSFLGVELALRNLPVGIMGDASYALSIEKYLVNNHSKVIKFIQNPFLISVEQLNQYISYLIFGGYKIENSRTLSNRKIYILDQQVDLFKFYFRWLPESIRTKIS